MLTKEKIEQFYKDVDSLGLKFPVAEIHRAMPRYSKGNVSEFLNKNKPVPEKFIEAFYAAFGSSIKVPREKEEAQPSTIEELVESNKSLSRAQEIFANAHLILAQDQHDLIAMLKDKFSSGADGQKTEDDPPISGNLLELLAEFGIGKMWKSKKEGVAELHRRFFGSSENVTSVDIRSDVNK